MVCVLGDWNFAEVVEFDGTGDAHRPRHNTIRDMDERLRWRPVLCHCAEHAHGAPTRFGEESLMGDTATISAVDRLYTAMPEYTMAHVRVTCRVGNPMMASGGSGRRPLSDHVPVVTTLSRRRALPSHRRPIPAWVADSPQLRKRLTALLPRMGFERLPPAEAWRRTKQVLRATAAAVRDKEMGSPAHSTVTARQRTLQLMRAIDRNEIRLLRKVLPGWPEAQAVVDERSDDVYVRDDAALRQLLASALHPPDAAASARSADATGRRRTWARRVDEPRTRRWMQLWVPHRQRTWLARVTLEGAENEANGRQMTPDEALHAYWSTRFQLSDIDERLQTAVVRVWTPPMQAEWPMPSATSFGKSLRSSKKTSPGPDGLPNGVWRMGGVVAATHTLGYHGDAAAEPKRCHRRVFAAGARTRDASATRPLTEEQTRRSSRCK